MQKETTHYNRIYAVLECNDYNGILNFPKIEDHWITSWTLMIPVLEL